MKQQRGFTIIELIVVIGIIAVLTAVVVSNYRQSQLQFALSRTASQFAEDVRRAQSLALSKEQYNDASGTQQQVNGYGVYLDLSGLGNTKYLVYADAQSGSISQQYDSSDYIISTVNIGIQEPGVIIKEIDNISGTSASINFNSANLQTNLTPLNSGQSSVVVVFALASDTTKTKSVSINTSGLVQVQ